MSDVMKINDEVSVGGQPDRDDLDQFAKQGFKSVVNFRAEEEEVGQLEPDAEEAVCKAAGMAYLHVPVSMDSMGPEVVDRFRAEYEKLPKPVFAHCKSGKRAGAMVMMDVACKQGMSGKQTLEKAEQMGFECDQPELKQFVESYVDNCAAK